MAKKKSILGAILKIVLGILGVVVLVAVGGYCYLKFAMGIDIIDITNKLGLLAQTPSESEMISTPYEKEDGVEVLSSMFGSNDIVTRDGDKYNFNLEAYIQADLQVEPYLSGSDAASLFALFIDGVDANSIGIDEDLVKYISLKQIKFSNAVSTASSTSVDINYIFAADLLSIKQSASEENAIIGFLVNKFVPDTLYLSSTFNIEFSKENYQDYTITNSSFIVNSLSQEQTNSVLDVLSLFSNEDLKETLPEKLNTMFCNTLFGGDGKNGLVGSIKGVGSIEFIEQAQGVKMFIKKV